MNKEKLNDEALLSVAKKYYRSGCCDDNAVKVLNQAGNTLTNIERNILLKYVDTFHDVIMKNARKSMSMKEMRNALLKKAGREDLIPERSYSDCGATSSAQLKAIYTFVFGIEEFKE